MHRLVKSAFLLVALSAAALAQLSLSPDGIVSNATKFNGKPVEAAGTVRDFKQKTSKKGNKYFTFKLRGAKDWVNVYSQGEMKPPLKDGHKVRVSGIFRKEKKVLDFVVNNEIDASPVKGKKYGVTPAK